MASNRRQQIRLSPDEPAAFFRERRLLHDLVREKVVSRDHRKLGGRY